MFEKYYPSAKRDLYAAFILRCIELCYLDGRIALVTQQSWMFLRGFAQLRALSEEKLDVYRRNKQFTGLLREISIEVLAHLGSNAFEEIGGEVVQNVMFTSKNYQPQTEMQFIAFRLVGLKSVREKMEILKGSTTY